MVIVKTGFASLVLALFGYLSSLEIVLAFSNDRSDNLAVYWGQDGAGHQQSLSFYCQDDTIDVIPMAFLYIFFGKGGQPVIDLSNICSSSSGTFPGTDLADCSFLQSDIKQCQAKGKLITLSLGGATSKVGFSSDGQASDFADTIWNMFLGGNSGMRPFGNAILDGVDLDIESGSSAHYATFVNRIRSLSKGASKRYYITAAPQCPFPDANVGAALNGAPFDAIYVQFYNNFCETSVPSEFNFATWDRWAKTQSPNPNVKVYLGAPGDAKAAGNGYVNIGTLSSVAQDAQKRYTSFGGVMLWDADTAYNNNRYHVAIKNAIRNGPTRPSVPTATSPNKGTPTPGPVETPAPPPATPKPTQTQTTAHKSTTSDAEVASTSFRDPRATARVKRPTFTFDDRSEVTSVANEVTKRRFSRFFKF
ncbi:glycoside hydrolase superfamily [Crucibulum laeve]|uniref:chitinase n=1 Tax=Crucibulum laeve TaxID=68775 RepID=A0A5C3M7M4_9AGAR|nr:glycoside hydrolase superfamily [Crucibulum laeve]